MKTTNYILTFLFLLFAYFQWNDPDPWGWMALYFYVAGVCLFAAYGRSDKYLLLAGMGVCVAWLGFLVPEFIAWMKMGMPDIAAEMKTEAPHIEYAREFLGLLICLVTLAWQYKRRNP